MTTPPSIATCLPYTCSSGTERMGEGLHRDPEVFSLLLGGGLWKPLPQFLYRICDQHGINPGPASTLYPRGQPHSVESQARGLVLAPLLTPGLPYPSPCLTPQVPLCDLQTLVFFGTTLWERPSRSLSFNASLQVGAHSDHLVYSSGASSATSGAC